MTASSNADCKLILTLIVGYIIGKSLIYLVI